MANSLYPTTSGDQFQTLRQANAVHAISHVACSLKEFDNVTESALTILLQRFHHPPSPLDTIIVDVLTDILLTGVVSWIFVFVGVNLQINLFLEM